MTTDKQKDYFAEYRNAEVVSGNGEIGSCRVVAQLKNDKWAIWESTMFWGGRLVKGVRLRDHSGRLASFNSKEEAVDFSNKIK